MTEQLYRMSWEPLSEADKSAPQVVRFADADLMYLPPLVGLFFGDEWRDSASLNHILPMHQHEFLCLTPVTPE